MEDIHRKIYREGIELNTLVSVPIPAGILIAAIQSYSETEWSSGVVSQMMVLAQEQIIDPVYWREVQAAHQEAHDQAEAYRQQMWSKIMQPGDPRIEPE